MATTLPAEIVREVSDMTTWATTAAITDQASYEACSDALTALSRLRRTIQTHFTQVKRPITRAHKEVVALEKAELAKVKPAEKHLQQTVSAWLTTQDAILRAEQADAVRALVEGGTPVDVVVPTVTPVPGQQRRQRRRAKVTDMTALIAAVAAGTVGPEVLAPNLPVLNKLVQQHGDLFEVPGVEVELLTTVVSR